MNPTAVQDLNVVVAAERHRKGERKHWPVTAASVMLYVMSGIFVLAVLGGQPKGVLLVPVAIYLAHGLNNLKASARIGAIIFASLCLLVNFVGYGHSGFTRHGLLLDIGFHASLLILLLNPLASGAQWVKRRAS